MNEDNTGIIEIMPNLAEVYARKVADLATSLNDPTIKAEATSAIRGFVVIPDPDAPDGVRLEVHGALAEILALGPGNGPKQKLPGLLGSGSQLSVVAGARFKTNLIRVPLLSGPSQSSLGRHPRGISV
ncbi:MAG: hypothetical protein AB1744_01585 [Candidatus Zixiibacteriota bacterium]